MKGGVSIGKKSILDESLKLSLESIQLYKHLIENHEFILSKQFFRAATSIGANVREAKYAESKKDFIHKYKIALKECNETLYWLELIAEYENSNMEKIKVIKSKTTEILIMLSKAVQTTQYNLEKSQQATV